MKKFSAFILTMVMLLLVIAPVTNASVLDIESIENSESPLWQTESCVTEVQSQKCSESFVPPSIWAAAHFISLYELANCTKYELINHIKCAESAEYSQLWCIIISLRVLKSIADKGDQKWKQPKNSSMRKWQLALLPGIEHPDLLSNMMKHTQTV